MSSPRLSAIHAGAIPRELRERTQWVLWRYEERDGKPTKVPYSPTTLTGASSTKAATWGTLGAVLARLGDGPWDGGGFVFSEDDPYTGIDLDNSVDEAGEVKPWARLIVDSLASYTEYSPSGRGLHIIVRGVLPPCRHNLAREDGKIEAYDRERYFTFTGRRLEGTPAEIHEAQDRLEAFCARYLPRETPREAAPAAPAAPVDLDDQALIEVMFAGKNGERIRRLWNGDTSLFDGDESRADQSLCNSLAFYTNRDPARIDRLFRQSALYREDKWGDRPDYRDKTIGKALASASAGYQPSVSMTLKASAEAANNGKHAAEKPKKAKQPAKPSQAAQLQELSHDAFIFRTPDGDLYASFHQAGHRETHPLRTKGFRRWLAMKFHEKTGKTPGSQAIQDTLDVISGLAMFGTDVEEVHLRTAYVDGKLYLDLCNEDWEVVEVTAEGWRVLREGAPRFRRAEGMMALPTPVRGGTLAELRPLLNVESDRDWILLCSWLVAAAGPPQPYPAADLHGEQGAAKSTSAAALRRMVDPNKADLRSAPREPRDLAVAANNSHVLCLDNLSSIPTWLSDILCRLSTGAGFSTRRLHTDDEEVIFQARRPVILTGIGVTVTRSDLLDRTLQISLPEVKKRMTEREYWAAYDAAWARILGALLDALATGLRRLPDVRIDNPPRMADFAVWATACEPAFAVPGLTFLEAYTQNRQQAHSIALEGSSIAALLMDLAQEFRKSPEGLWTGTCTELLHALADRAGPDLLQRRDWPAGPRSLSTKLSELKPNLRACGVHVETQHTRMGSKVTLTYTGQAELDLDKQAG